MLCTKLFIGDNNSEENEHQNRVFIRQSIGEAIVTAWCTEHQRRQTGDDTNNIHRPEFWSEKDERDELKREPDKHEWTAILVGQSARWSGRMNS